MYHYSRQCAQSPLLRGISNIMITERAEEKYDALVCGFFWGGTVGLQNFYLQERLVRGMFLSQIPNKLKFDFDI